MPKKAKLNELPCPACKEPCAADATRCPHCRTDFSPDQVEARKNEMRSQNKAGFIGCGVLAIIAAVGLSMCGGSEDNDASREAALVQSPVEMNVNDAEEPASRLTGPQQNALRSAKQYISMTGFSRAGLIEQLSSDAGEGYDIADATIAVDSLNVDWNEQAARSAKQYLEMSGFSCKGLIEQLSSSAGEEYTKSQAAYGAKQAGAC